MQTPSAKKTSGFVRTAMLPPASIETEGWLSLV